MKVIAKISSGQGRAREYVLSPVTARTTFIEVTAQDEVSAEIFLSDDELGRDFFIQVGNQPDIRGFAERRPNERALRFAHWDRRNEVDVKEEQMNLFRGIIGDCLLLLKEFDKTGAGRSYPLAMVRVIDKNKGGLYDRMVAEILDMDLPHFCLDDFKGQMYRNRFSLSFREGYTSYENSEVMLRAIRETIKVASPLIGAIAQSPQENFTNVSQRMPISSVRRIDGHTRRKIHKALLRTGQVEDIAMHNLRVEQSRKMPSLDTPPHRVIRWYLEHLARRCKAIEDDFRSRETRYEVELEMFANRTSRAWQGNIMGLVAKNGNQWAEVKANLESVRRKLGYCVRVRLTIKALLLNEFIRNCSRNETVFEVPISAFEANCYYLRLYNLILDFMRKRFWWVGDDDSTVWTLPKFELSEAGESLLQTKYSLVYENWCYARFVEAFRREGFEIVKGGRLGNEEGSVCQFERAGLRVKIVHGIRAEKRNPKSIRSGMFLCEDQGRSLLTPDFAIMFERIGESSLQWIIVDAKSNATMAPHMIEVRNRYAGGITYTADGMERIRPFACLLVRSGEAEDIYPGVEIPPPRSYRFHLSDDDHSSDDYLWRMPDGVVVGDDGYPPFHGHLRVNVKSVKKNADIFAEFVVGLVGTAERLLSKQI